MSDQPDLTGAFPLVGPLTYMPLDMDSVRAALDGPYPESRTWYHATWEPALGAILRVGLIPSCWWGGDSCCVFGYDRPEELPEGRRSGWTLEVSSRALTGQLRAWWVPPSGVRGAWHEGLFWSRSELRAQFPDPAPVTREGCYCELSELVSEQQRLWRSTWE